MMDANGYPGYTRADVLALAAILAPVMAVKLFCNPEDLAGLVLSSGYRPPGQKPARRGLLSWFGARRP